MSIVVATLCAEGIAMAADSRCLIQEQVTDRSTGEVKTRFLDMALSGEKIFLTANNVAIGITGRDKIKGKRGTMFLKEYFRERPGMNAKQVAGEINSLFVEDKSIREMGIIVAGYCKGKRKTEEARWETCQKPWLFELSTEERGKIRSFDRPIAVWKGEEDILLRLIGKEVTLREGRKRVDMVDFVIPFNLFSLRDAIAFSETGVELTMRIMQFQNREQSVGTPIDILTLTPDGAEWLQKS